LIENSVNPAVTSAATNNPIVGLDRDLNPGQLTVTVLSQKIQQPAESSRVVGDTGARDDPGLVIDDGHVVLAF
jgi:hypothetical protein